MQEMEALRELVASNQVRYAGSVRSSRVSCVQQHQPVHPGVCFVRSPATARAQLCCGARTCVRWQTRPTCTVC